MNVDPRTRLSVFTPSGEECLMFSFPMYEAICSKSLQVLRFKEAFLLLISFSTDLKTACDVAKLPDVTIIIVLSPTSYVSIFEYIFTLSKPALVLESEAKTTP